MEPPVSEDVARGRWMAINAVRVAGVAMVIVGLLIIRDRMQLPQWSGYLILAIGLLDIFAMPMVLARKWRSPLE